MRNGPRGVAQQNLRHPSARGPGGLQHDLGPGIMPPAITGAARAGMSAQTTVAFGELLKEYRLAAELTQEALAEKAGVSARNIQNLERGENKPLKDTARRLAEALQLEERQRALLLTAATPVP